MISANSDALSSRMLKTHAAGFATGLNDALYIRAVSIKLVSNAILFLQQNIPLEMIAYVGENDFFLQNLNTDSPNVGKANAYIVLIKADWCGHCRRYLPQYEQFSVRFPKTKNERLLERWTQLAHPQFKINGFPTIIYYNGDGKPVRAIENRMNLNKVL